MATRVWAKMKATDSRECRSCHDFSNMDTSAQDRTARSKHSAAPDKGETCIDCHKGVAHKEPDEPEEPVPSGS
jgi:cytochrome c-type protein NapC